VIVTQEMCNRTSEEIKALRQENRFMMCVIIFICTGIKILDVIPF